VTTVARGVWKWPWIFVGPVASLFFALDVTFVASNAHKIPDGGWFPLIIGALALTLMLSWRRGREVALARREEDAISLQTFLDQLSGPTHPVRVPGTAVYFTTRHDVMPAALALNLKHNGVVHTSLIFLRVSTARMPLVTEENRMERNVLAPHIQQVEFKFGFAETPDVLAALMAHAEIIGEDTTNASFFLGREVPIPALRPDVPLWQEKLYAFMTRNAVRAPDYFLIPPTRVVELGTKVEL
jgi:KUP system potassium uptake protein